MSRYDLYGIHDKDIGGARARVETALAIRMVPHEGGYRGGEYFRFGDVGGENYILQINYNNGEAEWAEPAYAKYPILLYVSETERGQEIATALNGVGVLLRTEEL